MSAPGGATRPAGRGRSRVIGFAGGAQAAWSARRTWPGAIANFQSPSTSTTKPSISRSIAPVGRARSRSHGNTEPALHLAHQQHATVQPRSPAVKGEGHLLLYNLWHHDEN